MSKTIHQERRETLYSLLLKTEGWVLQEEIAAKMYPKYYADWDEGHFHDSGARARMTDDIQLINNDPNFEKIIICSNDGIKIATEEDIDGYLKSQYSALFRKLKRIRNIERKAGLDGQIKADFDGHANRIIEAFKREAVL
jgi:hypothetical protein